MILSNNMVSIGIEGGDKVGKHTAVIATVKTLLLSGYKIIYADFPQYWNFGGIVPKALRSHELNLTPEKEIEIRCVLFSIDRALSLPIIEQYIKEYSDAIYISDRGWLSNCFTVGYGIAEGKISKNSGYELTKHFKDFDSEYIKIVKPESVLISTGKNGKSAVELGLQQSEDVNENVPVQDASYLVYKDNFDLKEVYTQTNGEWRKPIDIAHDIISTANVKTDKTLTEEEMDFFTDLSKHKHIIFVSPENLFPFYYGKEWEKVQKKFKDLFERWPEAIIEGDKTSIREIDKKIAEITLDHSPVITDQIIPDYLKKYLQKIFLEYPEVEQIIKNFGSEKYFEFIKSLKD